MDWSCLSDSPTFTGLKSDDYQYYDDTSFFLQSFSLSYVNKTHLENGNRIIMPASSIHSVVSGSGRKIKYPMTFEIANLDSGKVSHCGVLEFSAEDGRVYIPDWMMHNLLLQDGQYVKIEKTGNLAKATYMKIQPHSTDFVKNLSEPQVVLEEILKDFVCVTVGDTIMVNHENQSYYVDIVEADPEDVVSLFDTDCQVDVAPPSPLDGVETPDQVKKTEEGAPGKQESEAEDRAPQQEELEAGFAEFKPFTGVSRLLDGKKSSTNCTCVGAKTDFIYSTEMTKFDAVICSEHEKRGTAKVMEDVKENKFQPFTGKKYTLSGS